MSDNRSDIPEPVDGEATVADRLFESHSAESAPDAADVAATSVDDHDEHQPLVEGDAPQESTATSPIVEPQVIAPSTLRGPSHETGPVDAIDEHADASQVDATHADAEQSSLEQPPVAEPADDAVAHDAVARDAAAQDAADTQEIPRNGAWDADAAAAPAADPADEQAATPAEAPVAPPALVEPARPTLGIRRRSSVDEAEALSAEPAAEQPTVAEAIVNDDVATDASGTAASDADASDADAARTDASTHGTASSAGASSAGIAAAGAGVAGATVASTSAASSAEPETTGYADPAPTQAMSRDEIAAATASSKRPADFEVDEPVEPATTARGSIPVDDETARAAATGTPIVLVEQPEPPKKKGARGVGFLVVVLATVIFAAVFAAAVIAVGYLFDRSFDLEQTVQELWLRPAFLVPVGVFFLAYWLVTIIVNRAGWWAHVLGAFIVALLTYGGHIAGVLLEQLGGWGNVADLPGFDVSELGQLILAPLSVLAFVVAREVPIWVGGLVARRGRTVKERNRRALEEFHSENAEKLAAYETARG